MTYLELLNRICDDGIAEVTVAYADPKDHHKRDGAIDGFTACRGRPIDELLALWTDAHARIARLRDNGDTREETMKTYWRERYRELQIEWVLNVLSVGLPTLLLSHLPTARAALQYAKITGDVGAADHGVDDIQGRP
ncbi:MAG: hypothetical protein EPN91_00235 [Salinibacterium sp.]|nr:MAG: hypothetical protein EPN91_00235 [Salinibacterium sp.]